MKSIVFIIAIIIPLILIFINFNNSNNSYNNLSVNYVVKELYNHAQLTDSLILERVAIGYNTNLDLACNGVQLLNKLNQNTSDFLPFKSFDSINTLEEFGKSFGYYFKQGSAAERPIINNTLWNDIIHPLQENKYNDCSVLPGGNAALIANRLSHLNISVLLGGPVGNVLESLLHSNIYTLRKYASEYLNNTNYPEINDEIHLIMEYATNEQWDNIISPRDNRFIVSHDIQNSHLSVMEEFHKYLDSYNPQVIIIAGAHLLESLPIEKRNERLKQLEYSLSLIPSSIAIHLEIASVGDINYLKDMITILFPLVDSIGLNEQELGMIYLATGGSKYTINDFIKPSVEISSHAIDHIIHLPFVLNGKGTHEINRIHLHYLTYHLISQRVKTKSGYKWNKDRAQKAVAAGSLATSIQACGENNKLPPQKDLYIKENGMNTLFSHFKTKSMEYWVAPVAMCIIPKRTVGLGDCISATGLANHFG